MSHHLIAIRYSIVLAVLTFSALADEIQDAKRKELMKEYKVNPAFIYKTEYKTKDEISAKVASKISRFLNKKYSQKYYEKIKKEAETSYPLYLIGDKIDVKVRANKISGTVTAIGEIHVTISGRTISYKDLGGKNCFDKVKTEELRDLHVSENYYDKKQALKDKLFKDRKEILAKEMRKNGYVMIDDTWHTTQEAVEIIEQEALIAK